METSQTMVENLQSEATNGNSAIATGAAVASTAVVAVANQRVNVMPVLNDDSNDDDRGSVSSHISTSSLASAAIDMDRHREIAARDIQITQQLARIAELETAQRQSADAAEAHAAELAAANRATAAANDQRQIAEQVAAQRAAEVAAVESERRQAAEQLAAINARLAAEETARVEKARQEAETLRQQQVAAAALAAQQAATAAAATAAAVAAAQTLAAAQQSHRTQMLSVVSPQFAGHPQVTSLVEGQIQAWGAYIIYPAFTLEQLNMKKNELIALEGALGHAAELQRLAQLGGV